MSIRNIDSGSGPSHLPNNEHNGYRKPLSKKIKNLWSKIKDSSKDTLNDQPISSKSLKRTVTTSSSKSSDKKSMSREEKLGVLGEKTQSLASSAANFSETAKRLEKKYKNQNKDSSKDTLNEQPISSKSLKRTVTTSSSKSSDKKSISREEKLGVLGEKTQNLASSAANFSETAKRLEEKYKKQADKGVSEKFIHAKKQAKEFLSFVKSKFSSNLEEKEFVDVSSTTSEDPKLTLENLEEFSSDLRNEAETVESVNSCIDDCCSCLKKLKNLFKGKTYTEKETKSSYYQKFKKSLLKSKESIIESTESFKSSFKKRIRNNSIAFKQKVHEKAIKKLLKTSSLEDKTVLALLAIRSYANITGFHCKFNTNGISLTPKSGTELFIPRITQLTRLVDELLEDIDRIDPTKIESEEIETKLKIAIKEFSTYSNYLQHVFGVFY